MTHECASSAEHTSSTVAAPVWTCFRQQRNKHKKSEQRGCSIDACSPASEARATRAGRRGRSELECPSAEQAPERSMRSRKAHSHLRAKVVDRRVAVMLTATAYRPSLPLAARQPSSSYRLPQGSQISGEFCTDLGIPTFKTKNLPE